jgi:shikimate dehydrogenase
MATYGLLGRTLGHSLSPAIHARLGSTPYDLFEVEPEGVEDFLKNGGWDGLNVTIPYKLDAARLAAEKSPAVEKLGAANTLVRRPDGTFYADNTDVVGFRDMAERFSQDAFGVSAETGFADAKVLVLGTGGASKAVAYVLETLGCRYDFVSRSGPVTYDNMLELRGDATVIVNTTPVGMSPACPASPLTDEQIASFPQLAGIMDIVYNPRTTGLARQARDLGLAHLTGLSMLVAQAVASAKLFLGTDFPESTVDTVLKELETQALNVFLIGMPGCGKTGAGRRLANDCGRPFVDLDDAFTAINGFTPAECIVEQGEDAFRALETQCLAVYGAKTGQIVATGGGIVTRPENLEIMRQNGLVVLVNRPVDELSTEGRPLSKAKGIVTLWRERMPLYKEWADIDMACTGSAQGDADYLRELLGL